MLAVVTWPLRLGVISEQVCDGVDGSVATVIAYWVPLERGLVNRKAPSALTVRLSVPSESTNPPPSRPLTVPLTVKLAVVQTTVTAVALEAPAVPVPLFTVQV